MATGVTVCPRPILHDVTRGVYLLRRRGDAAPGLRPRALRSRRSTAVQSTRRDPTSATAAPTTDRSRRPFHSDDDDDVGDHEDVVEQGWRSCRSQRPL